MRLTAVAELQRQIGEAGRRFGPDPFRSLVKAIPLHSRDRLTATASQGDRAAPGMAVLPGTQLMSSPEPPIISVMLAVPDAVRAVSGTNGH